MGPCSKVQALMEVPVISADRFLRLENVCVVRVVKILVTVLSCCAVCNCSDVEVSLSGGGVSSRPSMVLVICDSEGGLHRSL